MSITVEDGSGLADATSYVSLADANDYAADAPVAVSSAWTALTDAEKEVLLAYSSRLLDQRCRWNGNKAVSTSAMRWPRTYVCDRDGLPLASDAIPRQLVEAVCDVAMWMAFPGRGPFQVPDSQGIQQLTVDVITVIYKADHDATSAVALPPGLNQTLRGLGVISYGKGSTFAPISKA